MRILHVVPSYLPATRYGGPIYSVHALCAALGRQGHQVEVFTTNVDGPTVSTVPIGTPVDLDGVKISYFSTGVGRRLYRSPDMGLALHERAHSFDVIHIHSVFLWPTTAASRAARRSGVPYLISPRGMLVADLIRRKSAIVKTAWIKLFDLRNLAEASAIHMTSDIEADEFRKLELPARRIVVIANGVDLPRDDAKKAPVVRLSAKPTILSLGRINWKKGLDRLIRAMKYVPDAQLVIVGNDEEGYLPKLEALASEQGVASRVEFKPAVLGAAKWDMIAGADVFVLASYSENFGNVALEAMASGVPVVVTPEVGLASTIRASGAGLVVDGDPPVLGKAIAELLKNPDRRRSMGENGRRSVDESFSWDAIAGAMVDAYADAISSLHKADARLGRSA